jgi:hypothetical protein
MRSRGRGGSLLFQPPLTKVWENGEPENTGNKSMTTALQVTNNGHTWGGECKSGDDNVRLEDKHSFPSMTFS